jgi:hypothetical protein
MFFPLTKYIYALLIIASNKEIIAKTIKIWISPLTLYTKTPSSQPIIKITAMMYRRLLIKKYFSLVQKLKNLAIWPAFDSLKQVNYWCN